MEIQFDDKIKKIKNPTIIEGFPGFGLVGSIATEFLLEHLNTEQVGQIFIDDIAPVIAIHNERLVQPMAIHYNKKFNMLILHVITSIAGNEWVMTEAIRQIEHKVGAKEILSIEGVAGRENEQRIFYYTKNNKTARTKELEKADIKPLKEGIIMGVTAGLLLKVNHVPMTCLFAETHSNMPDSKAAAGVIRALDVYLGLDVDYHPLVKSAERFEDNLKDIMSKTKESEDMAEKKRLSYVQ